MKSFIIVKDSTVFWGSVKGKQIISTFTNVRRWATKLNFNQALRVGKIHKDSQILSLEEFKDYTLNGEI
jgi:hypothetical protein